VFDPVYPGVTEEVCVPILEENSGLIWKRDFNVGYSPERINPGDREHTLERITKVVAGDNSQSLEEIARLYASVVDIIKELESYSIHVRVHDPLADKKEARAFYGIDLKSWDDFHDMDALILAVGHRAYREMPLDDYISKLVSGGCIIDVKGILKPEDVRKKDVHFWRL